MKKLLYILCLLTLSPTLNGQEPVYVTIHFSETGTNDADSIVGGMATNATVCLDDSWNETEVPLLPPEGLFPVFELDCIDDITNLKVMSQVDMRPWPSSEVDSVVQDIKIQREFGQVLTLRWDGVDLPSRVDSIVVSDPFAIYVGRVDMPGELVIDNEFVRDMTLTWYIKDGNVDVVEESYKTLIMHPNPVEGNRHIVLSIDDVYETIDVFGVAGNRVATFEYANTFISPNTPGVYIVRATTVSGEVATSTLVVQ